MSQSQGGRARKCVMPSYLSFDYNAVKSPRTLGCNVRTGGNRMMIASEGLGSGRATPHKVSICISNDPQHTEMSLQPEDGFIAPCKESQ